MLQRLASLGLIGVAFCGLGCSGTIGDADYSSPAGPGGPGGGTGPMKGPGKGNPPKPDDPKVPPGPAPTDDATVPGAAPLRRLTRLEYVNTVRDLLGFDVSAARLAAIAADQESASSGFVRGGAITAAPDARTFMLAAEELGAKAVQQMPSLLPCAPMPAAASEQDSCADKFLAGFARRAYRRPLLPTELEDLRALYRSQRQGGIGATFPQAVGNAVAAILQSPYFLYRFEQGPSAPTRDGALVRFNQHEIASQLSYLFWSSMPDDKLFAAADGGKLGTPDQVAAEARRLLADPKAREALTDFHLQWLGIGDLGDLQKDPSLTDWTPEMARSMVKETREFVGSVFQGAGSDGKLETLLTSPSSYVDATLAKLYGIDTVKGAEPQAVMLKSSERAGLFTQGTFLTSKADAIDSHPIKRGDTVLGKLLCIHLEIPNDIMVPPLPEPMPGQTTRERVSVHSEAACATCHKLIDPVGFAFENYDAIGRYRTTEEKKTVDASGSFTLGGSTLTFKNALDLMPQLARSQEARDCLVTQWWRYALRRKELMSEEPSLNMVREAFKASGHDLRELVVAFTRTRGFSHRSPSADEVLK